MYMFYWSPSHVDSSCKDTVTYLEKKIMKNRELRRENNVRKKVKRERTKPGKSSQELLCRRKQLRLINTLMRDCQVLITAKVPVVVSVQDPHGHITTVGDKYLVEGK